jgi:hypothetical protein
MVGMANLAVSRPVGLSLLRASRSSLVAITKRWTDSGWAGSVTAGVKTKDAPWFALIESS